MTKILLVEDDKSLREIYGVRLLAEGYDIVSAGDGEEALAMAIKERPQLIVSDVMMPKISGFDMLDILRSTTETKDIKVIMMTALSSEDQRQRGEQLGADRYLVKSQVGIEDVVRTVHEVLADAPVSQATFAKPAEPTAPASPSATVPPQPATMAPAPVATPAPATPAPAPTPVTPAPQPAPVTPPSTPAPVAATPAPSLTAVPVSTPPPAPGSAAVSSVGAQDTGGELPAPTAPFSSPRPATLGERVIQPMDASAAPADDIASRIAAELASTTPAAAEPVLPAEPVMELEETPRPTLPPQQPPAAA